MSDKEVQPKAPKSKEEKSRPAKKKPSFVIPAEIPAAAQSGWVYRSDLPVEEKIPAKTPDTNPKPSRSPDPLRPVWLPLAMFYSFILAFMPSKKT